LAQAQTDGGHVTNTKHREKSFHLTEMLYDKSNIKSKYFTFDAK